MDRQRSALMTTPPLDAVADDQQRLTLGQALLGAERTGQLSPAAWPLLRDILLASNDPAVLALVALLRAWMQARQMVMTAYQDLEGGMAAVTAAQDTPHILADAAAQLSMRADELAARARQLADLERERR
ncbi:hypothetical protein F8S13_22475 [Chloroflexia bacterium SDU3-3]|nr:hypothetical protein F8S13_22475 [Chloroflexia bacterium SDU3-3]